MSKKQNTARRLQNVAAKLLKEGGWNLLLIGNISVVKNPNNPRKLCHWLVVEFLGAHKRPVVVLDERDGWFPERLTITDKELREGEKRKKKAKK